MYLDPAKHENMIFLAHFMYITCVYKMRNMNNNYQLNKIHFDFIKSQ